MNVVSFECWNLAALLAAFTVLSHAFLSYNIRSTIGIRIRNCAVILRIAIASHQPLMVAAANSNCGCGSVAVAVAVAVNVDVDMDVDVAMAVDYMFVDEGRSANGEIISTCIKCH